jgi:hypothetical protein
MQAAIMRTHNAPAAGVVVETLREVGQRRAA